MRDDVFEFLAAQEAGRVVVQARRDAEVRPFIDKIKARQRTERQEPKSDNVSL